MQYGNPPTLWDSILIYKYNKNPFVSVIGFLPYPLNKGGKSIGDFIIA